MHCTAAEFAAHREKTLKRLQVSDHNTNRLIDAKKAYWVVGGNKSGIMTKEQNGHLKKKTLNNLSKPTEDKSQRSMKQ
jgi:hypothetical protein